MPIPFPQYDLPDITGGADLWDEPQASVVLLDDYFATDTGVTGSVSVTLANVTSAADGAVVNPVTGTANVTLAAATSTASGSVVQNVTGTASPTLANVTSTASGTLTITGTASPTLAAVTSTASGTVVQNVTGTANVTLAPVTATASGIGGEVVTELAGGRPRFMYERIPAPSRRINDDDEALALLALVGAI